MGIFSLIISALKALPILDRWITLGVEAWRGYQEKKKEQTAQERKNEKDSAVDSGIDAALRGVSDAGREAGQQQAPDAKD